jgi:hypothetical protein
MTVLNDQGISSTDDIMAAIHTFLTSTLTNTWNSVDGIDLPGNTLDLDIGDLFVQYQWAGDQIDMSQSTASSTPVSFGGEAGDSSFDSNVDFPLTISDAQLWVFANDVATATDRYAHCIVEFNRDGRYMHFGFGQIRDADKWFTWAGGAYKYGAEFNLTSNGDEPWSINHRGPWLDSAHVATAASGNLATMRATLLRNQITNSKWLAFSEGNPATIDNVLDGDAIAVSTGRAFGRYGGGPSLASFQRGAANAASINMIPILTTFSVSSNLYMPLGTMPDVRFVNMGNIQPQEQKVIGSDTWQFFPWGQKLSSVDPTVLGTRNAGCAYLVS